MMILKLAGLEPEYQFSRRKFQLTINSEADGIRPHNPRIPDWSKFRLTFNKIIPKLICPVLYPVELLLQILIKR